MKNVKLLAALMLALILVFSCSTTKEEASAEEVVAETKTAEPVQEASQPAAEPVQEEVKAETVEFSKPKPMEDKDGHVTGITGTMSIYGIDASYEAVEGSATVTYPEGAISKDTIAAFFQALYAKYPSYFEGVQYSFPKEGTLKLTYPKSVTYEDGVATLSILSDEIASFMGKAEITDSITREFTVLGESVSVTAEKGKATVNYPSFISEDDIKSFFASVSEKYSDYLGGVTYAFPKAGVLEVSYPESVSIEEGMTFISSLSEDLKAYATKAAVSGGVDTAAAAIEEKVGGLAAKAGEVLKSKRNEEKEQIKSVVGSFPEEAKAADSAAIEEKASAISVALIGEIAVAIVIIVAVIAFIAKKKKK